MHIVLPPPRLELRRHPFQLVHQFVNVGFLRGAGKVAAKARQNKWSLFLPGVHALMQQRIGEQQPEQVAPLGRVRAEAEKRIGRRIEAQHVPAQVEHESRVRQVVHQAPHQRRQHAPSFARLGGRAFVGQQKQVAALGDVQFQHPRQIVQKGGRHADVAPLFQPCVPSQADAGERGDFLAPKSWRAAAATAGQTQFGRRKALAVRPQEGRQIGAGSFQGSHRLSHCF